MPSGYTGRPCVSAECSHAPFQWNSYRERFDYREETSTDRPVDRPSKHSLAQSRCQQCWKNGRWSFLLTLLDSLHLLRRGFRRLSEQVPERPERHPLVDGGFLADDFGSDPGEPFRV